MSSRNLAIGIVIIGLLIVGGVFFIRSSSDQSAQLPSPSTEALSIPTEQPSSQSATIQGQNMVDLSSTGFNPKEITINAGDTVTWMNSDNQAHTVNSDPHPRHTLWPFINTVGQIQAGQSKSLKFPDPGTYTYHDHYFPQNTGTVVVK